jgi:geranylgeranyl diphosphate synthase type II
VNVRGYLERKRRLIDRALEAYFPAASAPPPRLIESVRYSLLGGGKRIRPILLLAAAEAAGDAETRPLLPFACAVEMIHTYSLIHDDLPAMDDDRMRRGKPTNHTVFGEAVAILAGDALLTEAFRVLATACEGPKTRRAVRAVREIAEAAGVHGMVGGQAADIEAEGSLPDLPTVEFIHVRKTGALILAAVRSGAILAGARARDLRRLTRYGEFLGLAFQVADDILDAEGAPELTGKTRGRDEVRRKATFPAVLGMPAAKQRIRGLLDGALNELSPLPRSADPLRQIARFIVERACETPR